jgi:hypothetical protein
MGNTIQQGLGSDQAEVPEVGVGLTDSAEGGT